jgi:hypothetical protein
MKENEYFKNNRVRDPYVDRRLEEDKRQVYDVEFFQNGGAEKRSGNERRQQNERRYSCVKVSNWSSVCPDGKA